MRAVHPPTHSRRCFDLHLKSLFNFVMQLACSCWDVQSLGSSVHPSWGKKLLILRFGKPRNSCIILHNAHPIHAHGLFWLFFICVFLLLWCHIMKLWERWSFQGVDINDTLIEIERLSNILSIKVFMGIIPRVTITRTSSSKWLRVWEWFSLWGNNSREKRFKRNVGRGMNWLLPVRLKPNCEQDEGHMRRRNWKPGDKLVLQCCHSAAQQCLDI